MGTFVDDVGQWGLGVGVFILFETLILCKLRGDDCSEQRVKKWLTCVEYM